MIKEAGESSGKRRKWLQDEVEKWKADGVISGEQAYAILRRYEGTETETEHGGRLVTVLAVIGAFLLGIGVILFFAANWQAIPKWIKVSMVLGSIIISYTIGYYIAFGKGNYPRVGRALIFLGSILYGSGIWLIAQIFHISSHYPNGILMWGFGIIPVAVICGSVSVLLEASLLLTLWTAMEQSGFGTFNWFFPLLAFLIIFLGYRLKSRLVVGVTIPGLVLWLWMTGFVSMKSSEATILLYTFQLIMVAGLLFQASGLVHSVVNRALYMKLPFQSVGLLVYFGSVYFLSFRFIVHEAMRNHQGFTVSLTYLVLYSLIALLTVFTAVFCYIRKKREGADGWDCGFLIAGVGASLALSITISSWNEAAFVIIANLILFAAIIAALVIGYRGGESVLINCGLAFFVLDVIARYFDFFWDMLDRSVFFMLGGLILLLGGTILERNRRKVLREMKVKDYAA